MLICNPCLSSCANALSYTVVVAGALVQERELAEAIRLSLMSERLQEITLGEVGRANRVILESTTLPALQFA